MKKIFGLAGALIGFAALTPANAAPAFHTVNFTATVAATCSVAGNPTVISGPFSAVSQQNSTFTVDITGSTANATTGELTVGTITCTSSQMRVTLAPNGWIKNGLKEITYSATLKNGSQPISGADPLINSASGTGAKSVTFPGNTLPLGLLINTQAQSNLTAGTYTGILAISVDPL